VDYTPARKKNFLTLLNWVDPPEKCCFAIRYKIRLKIVLKQIFLEKDFAVSNFVWTKIIIDIIPEIQLIVGTWTVLTLSEQFTLLRLRFRLSRFFSWLRLVLVTSDAELKRRSCFSPVLATKSSVDTLDLFKSVPRLSSLL